MYRPLGQAIMVERIKQSENVEYEFLEVVQV